jgi:predicted permease
VKRQFRIRRRATVRTEMHEEVEAHVSLAAESLIRRGVEPDAAWRRARERFGDFESAMQTLYQSAEHREGIMRRTDFWSGIKQDLTVSLRQMRRSPIVATAITITLALGIGANLVMFGIANRLLFSAPTGVVKAGELRLLDLPQGGGYPRSTTTNYASYLDLTRAESFSGVGAFGYPAVVSLGRGPRAEPIRLSPASASFFSTLGVRPVAGRLFVPAEDLPPRGTQVALIGSEFWQRKFGRDPSAIGQSLEINDRLYRIVGVLPAHFTGLGLSPVDVWLPMSEQSYGMNPDYLSDRGSKWLMIVARLKQGTTDERALAEVTRLFSLGNREAPRLAMGVARPAGSDPTMKTAAVEPAGFKSIMPGRNADNTDAANVSLLLVGVAAIVLLIACANVATLLLARAMRRTGELAVRLALGVSRSRLAAMVVGESALLAVIGGAIAILAAYLSRGVLQAVLLPNTDLGPALSLPVLGLGVLAIAVIIVLTSIAPALQVNRVDLAASLKGLSGHVSDGRKRLRAALLIAQVAMSAVLLVGAGLFVRSLENARAKRLGIDMDRVSLAEVAVHATGYDFARRQQFWDAAVRRVRTVPGVENAALTIGIPLRFSMSGRFIVPGLERLPSLSTGGPYRSGVDGQFFATIGARIIKGRGITDRDAAGTMPVIVVNETLARAMAPAGEALGKCVRIWRADTIPCATIVGIVEDISRGGVKSDPSMQYYMPRAQWRGEYTMAMLVRSQPGHRDRITAPVTRAIQELATDIPYPRVTTYERIFAPELRSWRLGATMFTLFGVLAFIVAVVGLYGLLAYNVASRRHEFGIRTALGAQSMDIVRLVLASGLALVSVGLLVGLGVAAAASRYVGQLLYDVAPRDATIYAGSAVLMVLVTAIVAAIPARRASAVAPTVALRGND